jgi:hypothetical protein
VEGYVGQQYVGMDLHRRRGVIVRTQSAGGARGRGRTDDLPLTSPRPLNAVPTSKDTVQSRA